MNQFLMILCVIAAAVCAVTVIMTKKSGTVSTKKLVHITRFFFIAGYIFAMICVSISYGIAIYSTLYLGETYTMAELSDPALRIIVASLVTKVVENIFEHNTGIIFGESRADSGVG